MDVDGGAGAAVLDSAVVRVVVGAAVAVLDTEAAEVTEVGVVLGVPLDEQLDSAMANAVDNIAVRHRRMARRFTLIATVSSIHAQLGAVRRGSGSSTHSAGVASRLLVVAPVGAADALTA